MIEPSAPSPAGDEAPLSGAPRGAPHRRTTLGPPLSAAACTAAATALVAVVDPGTPGRYPACPLLSLTGLFCPLCGGLRSVHALTHLDVGGSLAFNALTIPLGVLAMVFWIAWLGRAVRAAPAGPLAPQWAIWLVCAIGLAYGVLRNLPPFAGLAPPA